jgi:hypothetical protein
MMGDTIEGGHLKANGLHFTIRYLGRANNVYEARELIQN